MASGKTGAACTERSAPPISELGKAGYAKRISYVIGEDGRILRAYAKVDPKTHLDQVLRDLTAS